MSTKESRYRKKSKKTKAPKDYIVADVQDLDVVSINYPEIKYHDDERTETKRIEDLEELAVLDVVVTRKMLGDRISPGGGRLKYMVTTITENGELIAKETIQAKNLTDAKKWRDLADALFSRGYTINVKKKNRPT